MKTKQKILNIMAGLGILLISSQSFAFYWPKDADKVMTIEDPGKEYIVIGTAISYQQFPKFGMQDPLVAGITAGYTELVKNMEKNKADAIIGLRIEFNSRPMKGEEGRVLMYGTMIKYK